MEPTKIAPPNYEECSKQGDLPTAPVLIQPTLITNYPYLGDPSSQAIAEFLQRLNDSKKLDLDQRFQIVEILTGWLRENKFYIWQDANKAPFYGREESSCLCRQFCGNRREFQFGVKDGSGNVLLQVERPFNCSMLCGSLFPDSLVIKLGNQSILGYVKEKVNIVPHFAIMNAQGQTIFELKARLIPYVFHSGDRVQFKVIDCATKKTVGKIIKHWGGCCQEWFTSHDKYTIEFGDNWPAEVKALLLGTLFLINMRHYELCCGFFQQLILSAGIRPPAN